jgi:acyl dehydratase
VVASYAFAQLVHYAVWLDLAPRALGGPSLRREVGLPFLIAIGALTLAVGVGAIGSPLAARNGYLSLVIWHGWLELAALGHLWVRRDRQVPAIAATAPTLRAA